MAITEPEIIWKMHPNHKQQPGVCSCGLKEPFGPPTIMTISSCTYSSLSSSTLSSTCDSPHGGGRHRRITSDVVGRFSFVSIISLKKSSIIGAGTGTGGVLKKSRSIAFVAREKKKEGFWSKLIRSTSKRSKSVLVH
ncbi:hypothetical protein RND71_028588 [Anisodus tanguticus]|uniref:Uncharacterized protein n=1 Tax=Anisodus tanguticus TaxID=243964 RepID=A0AAE1RK28_9SOLA|nr:hypothetical protein RND71_028588 [Anisodus tanguticus]